MKISKYDLSGKNSDVLMKKLLSRSQIGMEKEKNIVKAILDDISANGIKAVIKYGEQFDGILLNVETIEVTNKEIDEAIKSVDKDLLRIMNEAAKNIEKFHKKQVIDGFTYEENGCKLGQRILPIARVGIYAPGGLAAYPSTVLMDAIPAKIAGVKEIIMCTPPNYSPLTLAAAKIAGVDRIFKIGGAQAIGAMAYGTYPLPKVDKIVGPGNIYVALAKREVFGLVGIDMVAGPSEVLVIADSSAKPSWVAADMLSQAEHDVNSASILITDDEKLLSAVEIEIIKQLKELPKKDIASVAIKANGALVLVDSIKTAVDISNQIAPEHLELAVKNPDEYLDNVENAGSIFMGHFSPEPLGDYYAGANHVLPTSGTARYSSPLGVYDFIKRSSVIYYTEESFNNVYEDIAKFAEGEGLFAHAKSATIRFKNK